MDEMRDNFESPSDKLKGCLKALLCLALLFAALFWYGIRSCDRGRHPPVGETVNEIVDDLKVYHQAAQTYLEKSRNSGTKPPMEVNAIEYIMSSIPEPLAQIYKWNSEYAFYVTENAAWVGRFIGYWWASTEVRTALGSKRGLSLYGSNGLYYPPPSVDKAHRYRAVDDVVWMLVENNPSKLAYAVVSGDILLYAPRQVFEGLQAVSHAVQQYLKANSQDTEMLLPRNKNNLPAIAQYLPSQDIRWDLMTFRVSDNSRLWAGYSMISAGNDYRRFFAADARKSNLYGSSGLEAPPVSSRSENYYNVRHNAIWIRIPGADAAGLAMDTPEFLEFCRRGTPEEVELAIRNGADIHELYEGRNALLTAASAEKTEIVAVLLRLGADANAKTAWGRTALTGLFQYGGNPEVILMLLEAGAEVDPEFSLLDIWSGMSAHSLTPESVRILVERGLDVNAVNSSGNTVLILSANDRKDMKLIPILLDMGADANIRNKDGKRAIDYAKRNPKLVENAEIYHRLKLATAETEP